LRNTVRHTWLALLIAIAVVADLAAITACDAYRVVSPFFACQADAQRAVGAAVGP